MWEHRRVFPCGTNIPSSLDKTKTSRLLILTVLSLPGKIFTPADRQPGCLLLRLSLLIIIIGLQLHHLNFISLEHWESFVVFAFPITRNNSSHHLLCLMIFFFKLLLLNHIIVTCSLPSSSVREREMFGANKMITTFCASDSAKHFGLSTTALMSMWFDWVEKSLWLWFFFSKKH